MKYSIVALSLGSLLAAVCSGQTGQATNESQNYVAKQCDLKLMQIDSLAKFESFMSQYDEVVGQEAKPKRGFLNLDRGLRHCYDIGDELRALREISNKRHEGVCGMKYVNQLVDFHNKFLLDNEEQRNEMTATNKSSYAAHIFSLLAHQVAFTCKSQLKSRLAHLQARHDCHQVMASFLPQAALSEPLEANESQEPSSMSGFLHHFRRVEDLALITRAHSSGSSEPYFDVIVSAGALERIDELKRQCRQRERHYMSLFAPIVSLGQLGYEVPDELVAATTAAAADHEQANIEQTILKCWLATAQLCQGILRTHINAKNAAEQNEEESQSAERKLIEIKFGPAPSDVQVGEWEASNSGAEQEGDQQAEWARATFEDIEPAVVELAKKHASLKHKMKRKMATWARSFLESHVDIEGMRDESARKFMEALTRDQEARDSAVAFAGKKRNQGLYLAPRMVADDADTIVQSASFFVPKGIAIFFSSVVAICLSAVFVWFSLYALVSTLARSRLPDASGNFKDTWRQMRDDRMKTIEDKVQRKGWKDKMMVYASPTG